MWPEQNKTIKSLYNGCLKTARNNFPSCINETEHTAGRTVGGCQRGSWTEILSSICPTLGCEFLSRRRLFASWQDWQASCVTFHLDVALTPIYKRAYSTASIFNVSSLNASAVPSVALLRLCFPSTHAHNAIKQPATACTHTHAIRANVPRVKPTRHQLAAVLMFWQGTNGLILGHYHLKSNKKNCCCHQNLFSGIYNFLCRQVQVFHGIYFYVCRKKRRERGGDLSVLQSEGMIGRIV